MLNSITVVTCTHNPRADYLDKVLAALKSQTLSPEHWEFILIDNASECPIESNIDLSWHPKARHVREEKLGLTPARIRGIQESSGNILVFVDDDNVLNFDYLEKTIEISKTWSILGAWGGQIRPEFEQEPPEWVQPYLPMLAIREFQHDRWSNLIHQHETTPCGAGLCVRKVVAEKYVELVQKHPFRASLDRQGRMLTSCGDSDLAFTACDMGLGTGLFTALKLTHLIPTYRLQEDYLLSLREGLIYSLTILNSFRGQLPPSQPSWREKLVQIYHRWRLKPRMRRFHDAAYRGLNLARQELSKGYE
jgi:Glycosyl transferase family 2